MTDHILVFSATILLVRLLPSLSERRWWEDDRKDHGKISITTCSSILHTNLNSS
jgi:hypothetical protein